MITKTVKETIEGVKYVLPIVHGNVSPSNYKDAYDRIWSPDTKVL